MAKQSYIEKKETKDWNFLGHFDPSFLDIKDLKEYVKKLMEEFL